MMMMMMMIQLKYVQLNEMHNARVRSRTLARIIQDKYGVYM